MLQIIRTFLVGGLVLASFGTAAQETLWVGERALPLTDDSIWRFTCPSMECGVVGTLRYLEKVQVFDASEDGDFVRISRKPIDAACDAHKKTPKVKRGFNSCAKENGIVDGFYHEWVLRDYLSETEPEPRLADLVAFSDGYVKGENQWKYEAAAEAVIGQGLCTAEDFRQSGYKWTYDRSPGRYRWYFVECSGRKVSFHMDKGKVRVD